MTNLFMTGAETYEVWPLVKAHHYSKKLPSAITHCFAWRESGGLFGDNGSPLAAAIYGQPTNRNWPQDAIELLRLVRHPSLSRPISEFVAWTLRWLRENQPYPFCLSYADTAQGHHGGIYQATGWLYIDARTEACPAFRLPDGSLKHSRQVNRELGTRSIPKVAELKPGWEPIKGEPKHLYVYPLRKRQSALLRRFGWTVKQYPKPNAVRPADEQVPTCVSAVQPRGTAPSCVVVA